MTMDDATWNVVMLDSPADLRTPDAEVRDEPRRPLLSGPTLDDAEPIDEPTAAEVERRRRRPILYARAAED